MDDIYLSKSQPIPIPKFSEACDILERFRKARTEREKLKVLNTIKQKHPHIAERMAKLI